MAILEILGKIGFDWRMGLANLINFLIIFLILKKYAFGPIAKKIKEREDKINQGLSDAKRASSEVMMAKANYEKTINDAKRAANLIISNSTTQGRALIDAAAQDASTKADHIIASAKKIIGQEKEKMMSEIKEETVALAIAISEKILKEKFDEKKDEALIKKLIGK
ncbi:ATP synthase F0 subunit B [Candidatus Kuenenbacteria bacterium CG11_big_fil_rev_8_21_14_0_20_37_9]|uniref:ATP synthase subunit b n=2 Tax=Candidatus Kueneniibacteriota TaxID=1752740 RepID=A0A2M6XTJ8_9BACT|nr:MAG: ATP synthase F0 subunit B [Candidatus Kuenenbacteria bacterium CG1_02_38_13]PIR05417.1 MAG: ATP synthase F0 subunit B [Candidatus Kuenenbacteria bacterium CG11_big_fil_rev_8_21_14_0_20_37_9]PIU10901.1 MAG: ATP synthase F0 subunit B [Candidatus Kuenenbacteria bacterium CG08_land_8_20_14_0_20_37_23]